MMRKTIQLDQYNGPKAIEFLRNLITNTAFSYDVLPKSKWQSILTLAFQRVVPWMDGSIWIELLTLLGTQQLLKVMGPDVVSYSIWPFAIIHETRPEFKALLAPITRDFFSFIRNDENPNGLWAWLSEDLVTVQEQLTTFESKPPDYWWKFAYGSKKYNDWLDEPNHTTANGKESPRLDYIALDGLAEKGTPRGLGASTNDWVQIFFDASIEGLNHFIAKIKEEFEKFGIYVRTEILKTGEVFQEIWRNTKEFSIKKWTEGLGRITYLKTWNQIGELKLFWREQLV
ncbi:hypothetical protein [Paenibacillus fonticola]|uniref:hypothetical protein n=1 Tax=Paenibacillus fonticola TaxID=379896 RepID=UPI0003A16DBA|nr:hypothetical protein [Paenibacillus fonticola]